MTDLPPDVRDRAAQAAADGWYAANGRTWHKAVDAVVAVVAPEIARPLQARIEVLKTENLHLGLELEARDDAQWDLHQRLLPELAEAKEQNQRLHDVVHRERPSVGDMVIELPQLRAERDALQARVTELEALAEMWESRAKEVDAHRRALWDITGRDPKVWSEAHARAVLAVGEEKP